MHTPLPALHTCMGGAAFKMQVYGEVGIMHMAQRVTGLVSPALSVQA